MLVGPISPPPPASIVGSTGDSVLYRTATGDCLLPRVSQRCVCPTIETQENCGLPMTLSHAPCGGYLPRKSTLRRPQKTLTFLALTLRGMVDDGVQLDLTHRKAIMAGLEYLFDNLPGIRRGTQKHDRLM